MRDLQLTAFLLSNDVHAFVSNFGVCIVVTVQLRYIPVTEKGKKISQGNTTRDLARLFLFFGYSSHTHFSYFFFFFFSLLSYIDSLIDISLSLLKPQYIKVLFSR